MRKLLLAFMLCMPLFLDAQTPVPFSCGFEPESSGMFSTFTTDEVPRSDEQFVIKIFFHIITDNNGNIDKGNPIGVVPNDYGEEQIMNAVKALNVAYNQYNIFFKYKGFDIIANTALSNHTVTNHSSYSVDGCFNLFLANSAGNVQAYAGYKNTKSVFSFWALENHFDRHFIHEIGHNIGLLHTHQPQTNGHPCEHVTRDPNDPDYNADEAGDQVADTPAEKNMGFGSLYWDMSCEFTNYNNYTDCNGTPYEEVQLNYMGYNSPSNACEDAFILTPGQALRARTFLNNVTASHYLACFTTVEELYEPYHVEFIQGDFIDMHPQGGLDVKICCEPILECRFQKGFNYEFDGADITPSTYDPEDWPILFPKDEDFDVYVNEAEAGHYETFEVPNFPVDVCGIESFVSGMYAATRCMGCELIDETEMTQAQLEDEFFYNSFPPGYYFVNRTTNTGRIITQTVYVP